MAEQTRGPGRSPSWLLACPRTRQPLFCFDGRQTSRSRSAMYQSRAYRTAISSSTSLIIQGSQCLVGESCQRQCHREHSSIALTVYRTGPRAVEVEALPRRVVWEVVPPVAPELWCGHMVRRSTGPTVGSSSSSNCCSKIFDHHQLRGGLT